MIKMQKQKIEKSFTLIEVIIGTFLILIVFLGIFGAYQLSLKVVGLSKNKITATTIANEWIEKIRNLPYESIGTKGAELPFAIGVLDSVTTTIKNNVEYKTEIKIKFVIDSADGIGANDPCNWDYKKAEVRISWIGKFGGEVKLITDISPKDKIQEIQTCQDQPGGILSVLVFDTYGIMVPSPLIEVFNPKTGERVDYAIPLNGKHDFPLLPSSYKMVITKSGYSKEETFDLGENYQGKTIITPEKANPIVLLGQIREISFLIDKLSSMTVETRGIKEAGYPVISNVTFNLRGEKKVGLDANEEPIYKYSQNHTTNDTGKIEIINLEGDGYYFLILDPNLDLVEIESPPGTTTTQPISLFPDLSLSARLILKTENSLLVTIQNLEDKEPIFSATTTLSNQNLGYQKTQYTDEKGQTYFIPLIAANYNLEVEAPGYLATSTTVSVSGFSTTTLNLHQLE